MRFTVARGIGLLLLSCSTQALAQAEASGNVAAADAPATSDDIIVTARRREESVQKVPVAIQVFSGAQLESSGIKNAKDLGLVTPSLNVTEVAGQAGAVPAYELRGISTTEVTVTADTAVGIYVNEVYQARPLGTNQPLLDIQNVQVLFGPQGTLFGRNSTAGAVLFTSKRPTDKLEGEVGLTAGNLGRLDFHAILNLPVSNDIAIRFAGQRVKRDGYTRNIVTGDLYDGEDMWTGRVSLSAKFGAFENLTIADYYHQRNNNGGIILSDVVPIPQTIPGTVFTALALYPTLLAELAAQNARGPRLVAYNSPQSAVAQAWGISNISTLELSDQVTIKNIAGFRKTSITTRIDVDASPLSIFSSLQAPGGHQFSDELQLQAKLKNLNLIVGAYYFRENGFERSTSAGFTGTPGAFSNNNSDSSAVNTSKSVFAQGTYAAPWLDGLSLTAGGRYTWDTRSVTWRPNIGGFCLLKAPAVPSADCSYSQSVKYNQPTYNLSIDYQVTPQFLVYLAHRRGYRSGGFDTRATGGIQFLPYRPETTKDVEIGIKSDWDLGGDAHLRLNVAGYRVWYNDIQRQTVSINPLTNTVQTVVTNAARASIKGFEVQANLRLSRALTLSSYWGYVDAKHDEFVRGGVTLLNVPFGVASNSYGFAANYKVIDDDATGEISLNGSYSYRGPYQGKNDLPILTGSARAAKVVNASLEWNHIMGTGFSTSLFVRNLTDQIYESGILTLQTSLGFTTKFFAEPRTFGLKASFRF
jgi:iron complex outermembrane recepter protein